MRHWLQSSNSAKELVSLWTWRCGTSRRYFSSEKDTSGDTVQNIKASIESFIKKSTKKESTKEANQTLDGSKSARGKGVMSFGDSTMFGSSVIGLPTSSGFMSELQSDAGTHVQYQNKYLSKEGAAQRADAKAVPYSSGEKFDKFMFQSGLSKDGVLMSKKYEDQVQQVRELLKKQGNFTESTIDQHIELYYNDLGLKEYYFQSASTEDISKNLACVISARVMNDSSHDNYFPVIHQVTNTEIFLMARASLKDRMNSQNYYLEQTIEKLYLSEHPIDFDDNNPLVTQFMNNLAINAEVPSADTSSRKKNMLTMPYRLQGYRSVGSIFDDMSDSGERLRTYFLQKPSYMHPPESVAKDCTDLEKVLDVYFYAHKKNTMTEKIYQHIIRKLADDPTDQAIVINVAVRGRGYRLDVGYRRNLSNTDFFSKLGDCIAMWGCYSQSKYLEPLANGMNIITCFIYRMPEYLKYEIRDGHSATYLNTKQSEEAAESAQTDAAADSEESVAQSLLDRRIGRMIKSIKTMYVCPTSKMSQLTQSRELTVHEAAYAECAKQFALFFSASVGDAFVSIEKLVNRISASPTKTGGKADGEDVTMNELYEVKTRLKKPLFSESTISNVICEHSAIVHLLYKQFQSYHHPAIFKKPNIGGMRVMSEELESNFEGAVERNKHALFDEDLLVDEIKRLDHPASLIFDWFTIFNKHIWRTNFWKQKKSALSFMMKPTFLPLADYPRLPYCILFSAGNNFSAFHVRFDDIARGGIRVVQSFTQQAYDHNRQSAFDEAYKLAFTQLHKNKDIPESGAKGVILLNQIKHRDFAREETVIAFKAFIDSVLDVILEDKRVVDHLGKTQTLFLGPDEHTGTGQLMDWAAYHAQYRKFPYWRAFTTGKEQSMGGLPHDLYGMTTTSVEAYVKGICEKLGLDESAMTRLQTGGPDGDLGSNALLQTKCKTTCIVDGSGVLYDSEGLDRTELLRIVDRKLAGETTSAMHYGDKFLQGRACAFKVPVDTVDFKLPTGEMVHSGLAFRNNFHFHDLSSADLFNPCGGRPMSVTPNNVHLMFHKRNGGDENICLQPSERDFLRPRFKYIVEGANVFIADEARRVLEEHGVILFKDASTNKGGVTSSSFEVLAALSMQDEEFSANMCPSLETCGRKTTNLDFYNSYTDQVLEKIKENAKLEFEAVYREGVRTGRLRTDLTDMLSSLIIKLRRDIVADGTLFQNKQLVEAVLHRAIPSVLMPGFMSVDTLRARVPEEYIRNIIAAQLASKFYYSQNFSSEISPFSFMQYVKNIENNI